MRITQSRLKQLISEEINMLNEQSVPGVDILFGDAVGELQSFFGDQWNAYVKEVTEKSMDRCVKVRIGIPPWEVDQSCVAKVAMEVAVSPQFWGGVLNRGKDKLEVILGKVTGGDAGGATDIAGAAADVLGGLTGGLFENKSKRVTLPMLEKLISEELHRINEAEGDEGDEDVLLGADDPDMEERDVGDISRQFVPQDPRYDWSGREPGDPWLPEEDPSESSGQHLSDLYGSEEDFQADLDVPGDGDGIQGGGLGDTQVPQNVVDLEEELVELFAGRGMVSGVTANDVIEAVAGTLTNTMEFERRTGEEAFTPQEIAKAMEKWIYRQDLG